jgi:streptogramin lyase
MCACLSEDEPFILLLDDSYSLQLLATNEDGFAAPDGILIDSGNTLYLADEGGSAIRRWTPGEKAITLYDSASGLRSPEDMVRDASGTIYVTDDSCGGLWRFSAGGSLSLVAGPDRGLRSTEGIAIAPDGSILAGDGESGTVFRVTPEGSVSVFLGPERGIRKPEGLVYDENGNLYIADDEQDTIFKLDTSGCLHVLLDSRDGIGAPESIAYRRGDLFITDNETGKLFRYAIAEEALHTIAVFHGNLEALQGIAVSDQGTICMSVHGRHSEASYLFELRPGNRASSPTGAGNH